MNKNIDFLPKGRANIKNIKVEWADLIVALFNSEPLSNEFMKLYNCLLMC